MPRKLLDQIGPMAVRGRVDFLHGKIVAETSRISRTGRKAKIFCIACGPAWEAVNFIAGHPLADKAEFLLALWPLVKDVPLVKFASGSIESIWMPLSLLLPRNSGMKAAF